MPNIKPMPTAEFLAQLERDPVYVARRAESKRRLSESLERARIEQAELLASLREVGISASTVWDLVNTRETYPEAIPALVKALEEPYPLKVKEGIIRALTVKEARGQAGWPLLTLFTSLPQEALDFQQRDFRWVVANALTRASTPDMSEALRAAAGCEGDEGVRKRLERAISSVRKGAARRTSAQPKAPAENADSLRE